MYQRFISILIKKLDDAINLQNYYFLEVLYTLAIYVDLAVVFRIDEYVMDTYYFFELLMMHMSQILVFRMILKVHSSLEQKRILIVDNFSKKIKVSRQLN